MFNIKFFKFEFEPDFYGMAKHTKPIYFGFHKRYFEEDNSCSPFLLTLDYKKVLEEKTEVPEEYDGNQNNLDFVDNEEDKENHKKRRRSFVAEGSGDNTESLPENYRHVRKSIRGVRPEIYTALDRYFKRETRPEKLYPVRR